MTKFSIIELEKNSPSLFHFDGLIYQLSADQVTTLVERGMLLVTGEEELSNPYGCHRCRKTFFADYQPTACPFCHEKTWTTYTLLYCCECHALFEYYWHLLAGGNPYDRFPKCPSCKSEHWCPAEEERLKNLPKVKEDPAQIQARKQAEAQAYLQLAELRKQQQMKKLGLSPSRSESTSDKSFSSTSANIDQELQAKWAALREREAQQRISGATNSEFNTARPAQKGFLSGLWQKFKNKG